MKKYAREACITLVLILLVFLLAACGDSPISQNETPDIIPSGSAASAPAEGETPPEELPYDPLNDPNVHWGTEVDKGVVFGFMGKHIWNGWRLEELLLQVDDDALIAFDIYGARMDYYPAIDLDRMEIPEELDRDGVLTELVTEYARAQPQEERYSLEGQIRDFLTPAPYASTGELSSEEQQLWADLCAEIYKERGIDPKTSTSEESTAIMQEADRRLLENERYQEIQQEYEAIQAWEALAQAFMNRFDEFYAEEVWSRMVERGFIPVYGSLEENPLPERIEGEFFGGTFIGTAAQIKGAAELIENYEAYIFALALKP